jgi:hypothetical protein
MSLVTETATAVVEAAASGGLTVWPFIAAAAVLVILIPALMMLGRRQR